MPNTDSVDPSVKKRSLSSYLSNVTSRREELEKLKYEQEEKSRQAVPNEQHSEEDEQLRGVIEQGNANEVLKHKDSHCETLKEESEVAKIEDNSNGGLPEMNSSKSEEKDPIDISTAGEHNAITAAVQISNSSEEANHENRPTNHIDPLYRENLKPQLGEPSTVEYNRELQLERDRKFSIGSKEDENKEKDTKESEVDSDAPTEPASPPRPRRGRLIRGDQLPSLSPRNPVFDNESDSDLSDLDELKSVHLSSSVLRDDSSPSRQSQSRFKDFQQPSSPHSPRRNSPKKLKSHIATAKAKQKKSVYRDAGGRTKLQIACDKGNYELVKKLIQEENYDVNDQDNAGNTALHEAALNGHLEIVKLLSQSGADINIQSFEMFKDTPLIDASANGHLEVVRYLLSHGADPTIFNAKGLTAYESIEEESDLDDQEREIVLEIRNCLRAAARKRKNNELSTRRSSDNGAGERFSPSHKRQSEELLDDYEFFWTDITSKAGREKLFKASKEGKLAYVGAYLENGGRVDVKSFFEAVKFGHEDITSLFLAFGAQVNMVLKDGTTALMSSVGRGHVGTAKLLLDADADPTKKDKEGHTALYYAQNSLMGVVDNEEIELLKKAIRKTGENLDETSGVEKKRKAPPKVKAKAIKVEHNIKEKVNQDQDAAQTDHSRDTKINKHADENYEKDDAAGDDEDGISEEDMINVGRKRKTISPLPLEVRRQTLSPKPPSLSGITSSNEKLGPTLKKQKVEPSTTNPGVKVNEESPWDKEQRLKAEEEYIQRRLQNKKKKEQELLKKLAQDAEKREQEKFKQKLEEAKLLEEQAKQKQLQLEKEKVEAEIVRRKEIRSMYPLGLKLINFQDTEDYMDFLPLYYVRMKDESGNDTVFVLDLQVCVILKDKNVFSPNGAVNERIKVSSSYKRQLWNILKFILLSGGHHNSNTGYKFFVDLYGNSLGTRMKFEAMEYEKFLHLPINWIRWDDVVIEDPTKRLRIEQEMYELALTATTSRNNLVTKAARTKTTGLPDAGVTTPSILEAPRPPTLPTKFQHRTSTSWLSDPTAVRLMW